MIVTDNDKEGLCYDAAILIDMQTDFVPGLRKGAAEIIIRNQITIIQHCAQNDIPVVVLEYEHSGQTVKELAVELEHVPRKEVVTKSYNSGFREGFLNKILKKWHSKKLLLMGINAEYCVLETAQDALDLGYEIITSPGLISGMKHHSPDDRIEWYRRNGALINL